MNKKVRTKIGTAQLRDPKTNEKYRRLEGYLCLEWDELTHELPSDATVELVVVTDAPETKREVDWPEGAVWWWVSKVMMPHSDYNGFILTVPGNSTAAIVQCGGFRTIVKSGSGFPTDERARQAAVEALATAGEGGFKWKEVEPKYKDERWRVDWTDEDGHGHSTVEYQLTAAIRTFERCKEKYRGKCILLGMDDNLDWHEIDCHELI